MTVDISCPSRFSYFRALICLLSTIFQCLPCLSDPGSVVQSFCCLTCNRSCAIHVQPHELGLVSDLHKYCLWSKHLESTPGTCKAPSPQSTLPSLSQHLSGELPSGFSAWQSMAENKCFIWSPTVKTVLFQSMCASALCSSTWISHVKMGCDSG